MVTTRKRSAAAVEPEKQETPDAVKDEDTQQQKAPVATKGRKKAKTQPKKGRKKKEEVEVAVDQEADDVHVEDDGDVEITNPDAGNEEEKKLEVQDAANGETKEEEQEIELLPVTDDTPKEQKNDKAEKEDDVKPQKEENGDDVQHPSSSEEEGVVRGEVAPPASYEKNNAAGGDGDEDDLIRIEKELETNRRYNQIDAGTKKRLAVILEYSKAQPKDIDNRVIQQLSKMPKKESLEAMKMLDHSVRTSKIRNLSAYLSSMLRRLSKSSSDGASKAHGTVRDIAPRARAILQDLQDSHLVREGELDGKALGTLAEKPEELQILTMELFSSRNLRAVRNMTAYFMAQISTAEQGWKSGKLKPRHTSDRREHAAPSSPRQKSYNYVPTSQRQPTVGTGMTGAPYDHAQGVLSSLAGPSPSPLPDTQAKHYALEQVQWGVRVDEFQALSPHAKYVHPAAALRLQQLWDVEQNKLVSVLDDHSWLLLAGLDAPNSVKAVNETSERMKSAPDDLATINRVFIEVASKYPRREDAPPLSTHVAPPLAAPVPQVASHGYGSMYSSTVYDPAAAPIPSAPTVQLPGPAGRLSPALQTKIDEILGDPKWQGRLVLDQFDERAIGMLEAMPHSQAMSILADFGGSDPERVRNPGGYLIGCLRNASDPSRRRTSDSRAPGGHQRGRGRNFGQRGPPGGYGHHGY